MWVTDDPDNTEGFIACAGLFSCVMGNKAVILCFIESLHEVYTINLTYNCRYPPDVFSWLSRSVSVSLCFQSPLGHTQTLIYFYSIANEDTGRAQKCWLGKHLISWHICQRIRAMTQSLSDLMTELLSVCYKILFISITSPGDKHMWSVTANQLAVYKVAWTTVWTTITLLRCLLHKVNVIFIMFITFEKVQSELLKYDNDNNKELIHWVVSYQTSKPSHCYCCIFLTYTCTCKCLLLWLANILIFIKAKNAMKCQ